MTSTGIREAGTGTVLGTVAAVVVLVVLAIAVWLWGRYRQRVGAARARAEGAREAALGAARVEAAAEARAPSKPPEERLDVVNEEIRRLADRYGAGRGGQSSDGGSAA